MQCPHCYQKLEIPHYIWEDVQTLGEDVDIMTQCCNNVVTVELIYNITASPATRDSYGNVKD